MTKIRAFLLEKWTWAQENPLFWAHSALFVITVAFIFLWPAPAKDADPSDLHLRVLAMMLQGLGAYTVWYDLTRTARDHGEVRFLWNTFEWLKAGFRGRPVHVTSVSSDLEAAYAIFRGRVRRPINASLQIEERLTAIEANIAHIDEDITALFKEIDDSSRSLKLKIESEAQERLESVRATQEGLRQAVTGNVTVLASGVVWLIAGIILSALAKELSALPLEIAKLVARQ